MKKKLETQGIRVSLLTKMKEKNATIKTKMKETILKFNSANYCLEYEEGKDKNKINLLSLKYFYTKHSDTLLQIVVESHHFKPEKKTFAVQNQQDKEDILMLLDGIMTELKNMSYTNQLSYSYQAQEFETLQKKGSEVISSKKAIKYFESIGIEIPKVLRPKEICSFTEWRRLYGKMMAHPASNILQTTFKKFATCTTTNDWLMSSKKLAAFLSNYQQEEAISDEESQEIMRRHRDQVNTCKQFKKQNVNLTCSVSLRTSQSKVKS